MNDRCVVVRTGRGAEGTTGVTYTAGVSARTTGSQRMCLELATLPPGAMGRAHLHADHESAAYVLHGELVLWFGQQLEERVVAHAGDFLYIPPRLPHLPANGSATEPAIAVLARTDPNEQENVIQLPELEALPHLRHGVAE